jgi:flagellar M-ring protein FliF
MPAPVTAFFGRFTHALREFTVAQRTLALLAVAVLVLGGIALTTWLSRPSFTPLFSGVSGADASAIVEQLKADGVPYELTDGGSTVLVPDAEVDEQRLKAAAAGLPALDSTGYGLLDTMGVTASEFQQSVTYKRALEGELASTVTALNGVATASVRLAIPEETVFSESKADPTASVFVETERGRSLNTDQVQAIVHLTSAAVDGLKPDNVAVVDADGNVLSAVGVGATGGVDQQASDQEQAKQDAVQAMLDQVVGPGNATVTVTVDVSNESAERVEETFTSPEDPLVLSESTQSETYQGAGGGTGTGVLGPDNVAVPGGGSGDGQYESEQATRNNAINKVTETRTIPAGELTRKSVSVALNANAIDGVNVANLSDLVATAAGIDPARGDSVAVEVVPFTTAAADEAAAALDEARAAEERQSIQSLITIGIIALALTIAFGILAAVVGKRRKKSLEPVDIGSITVQKDEARPEPLESFLGPQPTLAMPSGTPMEPGKLDRMRADVNALAQASPERTADYLRALLEDRPA